MGLFSTCSNFKRSNTRPWNASQYSVKEGRESVDHFTGVPKGGGSGALVTRSSGKDFFFTISTVNRVSFLMVGRLVGHFPSSLGEV